MAEKHFSQAKNAEVLNRMFRKTYTTEPAFVPRNMHSSVRRDIRGSMSDAAWEKVCLEYLAFFSEGRRVQMKRVLVEGSLQKVFDFFLLNSNVDIFRNGAGKLLFYELLTLTPRQCRVPISTTTNPITDWCGVGEGDITGVVDIMATSLPPRKKFGPRVVGEVKGKGTLSSGIWQTIAAMQVLQQRCGKWPVGMLFC